MPITPRILRSGGYGLMHVCRVVAKFPQPMIDTPPFRVRLQTRKGLSKRSLCRSVGTNIWTGRMVFLLFLISFHREPVLHDALHTASRSPTSSITPARRASAIAAKLFPLIGLPAAFFQLPRLLSSLLPGGKSSHTSGRYLTFCPPSQARPVLF